MSPMITNKCNKTYLWDDHCDFHYVYRVFCLGLFDTDNLNQDIKKKTGLKRSTSLKEG